MSKEQENLRQKFKDETNHKLWAEDFNEDAGFSDKYVEWLEKQLLLYNVVGRSEQLKPFHCPNCKQPWDTRLTNSCQCGASIKRF